MKKAVIIGAGQTGRGFVAPIMKDNDYQIVFIDKDKTLVDQLNREKSYIIRYFGDVREKRIINKFDAFLFDDRRAVEEIASADIVLTSIFASHIAEVTDCFREAAKIKKDGKMTIICCENGVHVKRPLIDAEIDAVIGEGIIFCTTLKPAADKLDLISEDYPDLPIDGKVEGLDLDLKRMPLERDFDSLIQRKIYTYNFISAVVAYLGSYKGYDVYGEAANDPDIAYVVSRVAPIISRVIAKKYHIPYDDQMTFTNRAIAKFQNKDIYDTIYRNASQVARKLRMDERILTPLRLANEYHADMSYIEIVAAAALYYGYEKEDLKVDTVLITIQKMLGDDNSTQRITNLFPMFRKKEKLDVIIKAAERK